MLKNLLLVGLGGGIGSMLRYSVSLVMTSKYFPWPTLTVNIIGSFVIGIIFALVIKEGSFSLSSWKLLLATGVCGGFTTFSAFSLENMGLIQNGKYFVSLAYIIVSIISGIVAAYLGYQLIIKN